MDIDLFAEIVRNLILDNDEVTLPGLGTFVSEVVPSTFSDKGYTINPPYRRLSFRQRWSDSDTILADFYGRTNGTSAEDSKRIIGEFVNGLKETLESRKAVQLPGLGRLRATKENTFFFIADEDLDIYPSGFGLRPVSLKTHEETPEEVSAAVSELHDIITDPAPEATVPEATVPEATAPEATAPEATVPEATAPITQEPIKKQAPELRPAKEMTFSFEAIGKEKQEALREERRRRARPWVVLLALAGAVLLALVGFVILSRLAPDFTDSLLYTPEELRIINY